MNTGAFGENFPYSNFHDLNMDWIVKIAKDFLDQYTHIQQVIEEGETTLNNTITNGIRSLTDKKNELENALTQWYLVHQHDLDNQLASALSSLTSAMNSALTSFNQQADTKTARSIASIPDDYTALSNAVVALEDLWLYNIVWVDGGYIDNLGEVVSHADYKYTDYVPIANDYGMYYLFEYRLRVYENTYIAFYDSDKQFVGGFAPNPSATLGNVTAKIPYNYSARYARFCTVNTYDDAYVQLKSLTDVINTRFFTITWHTGGYVTADGSVISHANYKYTDLIPCMNDSGMYFKWYFRLKMYNPLYIAFYDKNGDYVSNYHPTDAQALEAISGEIPFKDNAYFVRFCSERNYNTDIELLNINYIYTTQFFNPEWYYGGYIAEDGTLVSHQNYKYTDYLKVSNGTELYYKWYFDLKVFKSTVIAFYDENKHFIRYYKPSTSNSLEIVKDTIPVISGAYYARFCSERNYTTTLKLTDISNIVINTKGGAWTDYKGEEIRIFNKILCIGDSLTEGTFNYYESGSTAHYYVDKNYSYPAYLTKLTGVETTNLGLSGDTSQEWYNTYYQTDLSGYDCAIIELGINDLNRYGGWTSASTNAFTNIKNKLKAQNPNIKIFVSTVIPATAFPDSTYHEISEGIRSWVSAQNDTDIILLDMEEYSHIGDNENYNAGHLTAYGYMQLAKEYANYISWYIDSNQSQFTEVQFIGTNYHYNH